MGGEATVDVVARHLLVRTNGRLGAATRIAAAARDHRRDDDRSVGPINRVAAGLHYAAADFMAERQGQRVVGANAIVVVAEIRMTDAAAGDLDQHLVLTGRGSVEFLFDKRLTL